MSSDALPIGLPTSLKNSSLVAESVPQETTAGPSDNDLIEAIKNKTKDSGKAEMVRILTVRRLPGEGEDICDASGTFI